MNGKTFQKWTIGAAALALIAAFQNCNYAVNKGSSVSASSYGIGTNSLAEQKALSVLSAHCASCHGGANGAGGVSNILDPLALVSSGVIVPGHPELSNLNFAVESGRMPIGAPLAATDIQTLRNWVAGTGTPTGPTPIPNPTPSPTPLPVGGTLEQKAIAILTNNCYICHGSAANGGLDQINNPTRVIQLGFITPGVATTSKIYDAINAGRMPPTGKLSASDIQTIFDWINAGAKTPTQPVPTPTPIALGPTYASLQANIFAPRCLACHSTSTARGGVVLDNYTKVMKYVRAGQPTSSKLYTIMASGEMPQSPYAKLNSTELKAVSDWIKAGGANN